jgi:prepilin-type N-terminal cleavage/methylation domain-containing protein
MMFSRRILGGRAGVTMIELMVALAVTAVILIGALIVTRYMIVSADDNRDKTFASLQVQYVGFWVSEDVVQAQTVELGSYHGFPLTLTWTEPDETVNEVVYSAGNMTDVFGNNLWRLEREQWVDSVSLGKSVVGEYLVPAATECVRNPHEFVSSLVLSVGARLDRSEATNTYEIHPRAFTEWLPEET